MVMVRVIALMVVVVVQGLGMVSAVEEERPLVEVSGGLVRGITTTMYNVTYLAFQGIPYAIPPVGSLRFKDPIPAEAWEGELDASTMPVRCNQWVVEGAEDCLFINVYTPQDALTSENQLPVMVYIHGGAYYYGGDFEGDGYQEFLARGVIVAALQYRLSLFGFLSTEDAAAPGNQGLKDQTLALRWIKENIASFGGDPERITIFGLSAGSNSVMFQLLAPSARGLFSGAIMQSGTALAPWALGRDFLATAQKVAQEFDCPTLPTDALVSCLQGINAHLFDMSYFSLYDWNLQPFYMAPRVDGDYLPDHPATLILNDQYYHVPSIMGVNRDELGLETAEMYTVPSIIDSLLANFTTKGPASLELHPDEDPVNTSMAVYTHYLGGIHITKEDADNLTQMYTDNMFLVPYDWTTQLMSSQGDVYTYELHHRGVYSECNQFLDYGLDLPQVMHYICHGDTSQYISYPWHANLNTDDDKAVGKIFVESFTNFAKTRNPTPDDSLGFTWDMTEPTQLPHLKILPQPYMERDQRAQTRAFWESLPLRINKLLNH